MVPYKRPAADKSGMPVYQPSATTYQQLMQLQQPFVPVSCEYSTSPAPPQPASSSAASSPTIPDVLQQQQQQQQQQPQQQMQSVVVSSQHQSLQPQLPPKESDHSSLITTTATLPAFSAPPQMPDPATLAKEVAQQNYAKAVKLAAVNQSIAASQFSHLNPLNYTGVSLNKQTLAAVPAPTAYQRYSANALPFQFGATSLNLGLTNPYQAAIAQQSLMNMARPPPAFQFNPYSIIRPQTTPVVTAAGTHQVYGNAFFGTAQYPVSAVTVSAAPMTNPTASTNIAVAAAQNNNNNVVLQPYKKLKTT